MKNLDVARLIKHFQMTRHPEGGAFRETYRSALVVPAIEGDAVRNASTAIYFLLEAGDFSAFHRIRYDEVWHFYAGDRLKVVEIAPDGTLKETILGPDFLRGETFQHVVPGGTWFASLTLGDYSLVGCTVAPGFDFEDFELADRETLIAAYPLHRATITSLTR